MEHLEGVGDTRHGLAAQEEGQWQPEKCPLRGLHSQPPAARAMCTQRLEIGLQLADALLLVEEGVCLRLGAREMGLLLDGKRCHWSE